ncbi:NAD-dependent epimerase/dehydratase family protein [Sphingobacterium sp. 18053]|uniref:NAD-dependent epimerase/dehydratase family protein n=1 Tax=Sphingobacterium sp. 18053 TaxID=2681401 RepID=UPI00135BFC29|nr:NAD-dependent epimerase/dehydratase family protein [Sphingobacterium sp. 18053]
MKIIITGSTGFVGKNLAAYLEGQNAKVKGLSLRDPFWRTKMDTDAIAIIHLAGKAHDTSNTSAPDEYFKINRDLTIALFEQFMDSDIRDFFYFSSVKAVADTVDGILTEDVRANPLTPYGKSKQQAEEYLLSQKLSVGKRLFIIRPCMIHGPGNKGNLNLLYKIVEKGIPWPLASFNNQRSFLSIDNLNFFISQLLLKEDASSGIYNFADNEALSTNELVSLIADTLKKQPKLWYIWEKIIKGIVKIGDILPLPLNSERLKKLTESYVVSNEKIKKVLKISKLPVTAKEGLSKTIKSFRG